MSNFFSGIAVFASLLALVGSGYSVVQLFSLQQKLDTTIAELNNKIQTDRTTTNLPTSVNNSPQYNSSNSSNVNAEIQSKQFVNNAFSNLAEVELLKVNRVPGQTGKVNVQMRIRLKPGTENEGGLYIKSIYFASTTASNADSGETYSADTNNTTPSVNLKIMAINEQASADAHVWLNVPDNVNLIDIYIPNTEAFTNVPISNS